MASVERYQQRNSSGLAAEHFIARRSAIPQKKRPLEDPYTAQAAKPTDTSSRHPINLSHWRPAPLDFIDGEPPQYAIVKYQAPHNQPETDIRILDEHTVFAARTADPVVFDFHYPPETVDQTTKRLREKVVEEITSATKAIASGIARVATRVDRYATQVVARIDSVPLPAGLRYTDTPAVADEYVPTINRQRFFDPEQEYKEGVEANPRMDEIDRAGVAFLLGIDLAVVEPDSAQSAQDQIYISGTELSLLRPDAPAEEQVVVGKRIRPGPAIIFQTLPDNPVGRVDPAVDQPALDFLQRKVNIDQLPLGEAHNGKVLAVGTDKEGQPTHMEQVIIANVSSTP